MLHLHRADRPLQLHEKERELRLPLSREEETSFLSLYVRARDPDYLLYLFKKWKRAHAQEEGVELPATFKQRSLVLPPGL